MQPGHEKVLGKQGLPRGSLKRSAAVLLPFSMRGRFRHKESPAQADMLNFHNELNRRSGKALPPATGKRKSRPRSPLPEEAPLSARRSAHARKPRQRAGALCGKAGLPHAEGPC